VSIGLVSGTVFRNPSNSGPFDFSQVGSPVFSQQLQLVDFNPTAASQSAFCLNSTGVNERTIPFTEVTENPDGTCGTVAVQGNGLQAGAGSLANFEAAFSAQLTVASPGQLTFQFLADDGWIFGAGQMLGGSAQPSYVSGQRANPPISTPVNGYPVVGANNVVTPPATTFVTVNFPAAGVYPIEIDYTECCTQPDLLMFNTADGVPVPPTGQPSSGAFGQSFGSHVCRTGRGPHARSGTRCLGDPVNSLTGAFTDEATDLSLPATGVSFEFARSYTSADTTTGRLGPGWTDSYSASLAVQGNGDVNLHGEDGQQVYYKKQANGSFIGAAGSSSVLSAVTGGYDLVRHDQVTYHFDSSGVLQRMRDRNGQGLVFAYTSGKLTGITDAAGRSATIAYQGNLISSVTTADGRMTSYGYLNGLLKNVTLPDPDGAGPLAAPVTTYSYDAGGRLASEVDPNNHAVFTNVYDQTSGRVTQQTDANGKTGFFAWDPVTQTATVTDANIHTWKDVYDNGTLIKRIDPAGEVTQFGFDGDLDVNAVTSPNGTDTTAMTYDNGNLRTATAPASLGSAQKAFTYDGQNNVRTVTDARQKLTEFGYDAAGNNNSVTLDGQQTVGATYNAQGQMLTSTDGNGNQSTYTYDSNGNLASLTAPDPDGTGLLQAPKTTYTYYPSGLVHTKVAPLGNCTDCNPADYTTSYTYDDDGHLLTETGPDPDGSGPLSARVTTHTYDAAGNEKTVIDANGHVTSYQYDNANHVIQITQPDPDGAGSLEAPITKYGYDDVGNRTTVIGPRGNCTNCDPGAATTTYRYNQNNQLESVTTPKGEKSTYTYDTNGNLATVVDPRGYVQGADPAQYTTTYTYDAAGRLLTTKDPLQNVTTNHYDPVGNLDWTKDANQHQTSNTYDSVGRLLSITAPDGGLTTFAYDRNGNLRSRTDANNHTVNYSHDADGRLTQKMAVGVIAAGELFSFGLKSDGSVWSWGRNDRGQLGNGTSTDSPTPAQVSKLAGVTAIAAGGRHSLGLRQDGTVISWGDYASPLQVTNLTGVRAIAAGGYPFSLALKGDGTVRAWGFNVSGELGNGTTTDSPTPVQVSNLAGVTAIAAGGEHSLALTTDGSLWAWGANDSGQLGNGSTTNSTTPVQIGNLGGGVTAISAGRHHSLALKADNSVWAWGQNSSGELGNGTTTNSSTPVQVINLAGVTAVAAANSFSLALKADGTVWAWGYGYDGELGNGTRTWSSTPVRVGNLTGVVAIATEYTHALALKSDGSVWSWGDNTWGELGNGTTGGDSLTPVQVSLQVASPTTYAYDANGNVTSVTDANGNATPPAGDGINRYVYDRADKLTQIDYSDTTPDVTFGYDNVGNRTSMNYGTDTVTYNYDNLDRLTGSTRGADAFSYGYDAAGNVTSRTYPGSPPISYGYDEDNRLASVVDAGATTTYSYYEDGSLRTTTLPSGNGYLDSRFYDRAGRLTEVKNNKGVNTLSDFVSTPDPVGNPTQILQTGAVSSTTTYGYDANDRLRSVCFQATCTPGSSDPFINWTYDKVGNRLTEERATGTSSYAYDALDELTTTIDPGGIPSNLGYDADGRQLSRQTTPAVTPSGNETTDAVRSAALEGDGRAAPDSSFGTWEGTTNQVRDDRSGDSTPVDWQSWETIGSATNSRDTSWSKFGSASTKVVTSGGTSGQGIEINTGLTSLMLPAGTVETGSAWVKGTGTITAVLRFFDYAGHYTSGSSITVALGSTAQRITVKATVGNGTTAYSAELRLTTNTAQAITFWVDGVQIERLPFATPYVKTTGTSATRAAANLQGPASVLSASQGWVALRLRLGLADSNLSTTRTPIVWQWRTDATHYLKLYLSSGKKWTLERDGTTAAVGVNTGTFTPGTMFTVVAAWTATTLKLSINGATFTSVNNANVPDLSRTPRFDLGSGGAVNGLDGDILWFASGTGTLAAADSTTLKNRGDTDPTLTTLPVASAQSAVWAASTAALPIPSAPTPSSFNWNLADRLTSSSVAGTTTNYSYDGDGNRLSASTSASTINSLWDINQPLPQLALERDGAGNPLRRYTYGASRISMSSGGNGFYYHYDALGSVANLTSANGTSEWTYSYEPFGVARTATKNDPNAPTNPMQFTGEYIDANGLYNLRARQYDTMTGRFTAPDPAPNRSGVSATSSYVYANDRPTVMIDPSGTTSQPANYGRWAAWAVVLPFPAAAPWALPAAEPWMWPAIPFLAGVFVALKVGGSDDQSYDNSHVMSELNDPNAETTPTTTQTTPATRQPPLSHPQDKLPQTGEFPYVPPKRKGGPAVVPNPQGPGYIDNKGDIWQWDEKHGGHWDVQPRRGGGYTKVGPNGKVIG
jgi:RHS repeat-associated protein